MLLHLDDLLGAERIARRRGFGEMADARMSGAAGARGAPAGGRRPRRSPRPRSRSPTPAPRGVRGMKSGCPRGAGGGGGLPRGPRGGPSPPRGADRRNVGAPRDRGDRARCGWMVRAPLPPSGRCSRGVGGAEPKSRFARRRARARLRRRIGRAVAPAAASPPPSSRTRGAASIRRRVRERRVRHVCDRRVSATFRVSERHVGGRRVCAAGASARRCVRGRCVRVRRVCGLSYHGRHGSWLVGLHRTPVSILVAAERSSRSTSPAVVLHRPDARAGRRRGGSGRGRARSRCAPGSRPKAFSCAPPRCRCCPRISRARSWSISISTSSTRSMQVGERRASEGPASRRLPDRDDGDPDRQCLSQRALVRAAGALAPAFCARAPTRRRCRRRSAAAS